jgi:hypothetical protein
MVSGRRLMHVYDNAGVPRVHACLLQQAAFCAFALAVETVASRSSAGGHTDERRKRAEAEVAGWHTHISPPLSGLAAA